MGDWQGVFAEAKPRPPPSTHASESDSTSLTRVDSSHSGGSRSERRQSKSLRNMFGKSSKNKTYKPPPIPEIGAAADRLPYNDGPRHRVELTPTELSDDISISRTSTNGGSSISSAASFIDSPTGAHPPQMTEKLARVFGTKAALAGPKAERLHPQGEEKPASRKRDSFLAAMPKRSLERPPTSAGPPVISAPLAAPPAKWEPPPFFKGLSGAVKHGSLMTCGVTANAVIYLSTHDKGGKNVAALGFGSDPVKADKAKEKHRQRVVETLGKAEWSRKIFVLTSAGYLLQFSCDGAFNRLPEQSIRLSRHSVAFASDVIPGRHWVIQITTVYDGLSAITPGELSATPAPPPQQRPGSKSTYIKPIKQFLLIMDNGEDLDTWLTAVRHEIDVLGGKASSEATAASPHPELSRSPLSETTNAIPIPSPHPHDEPEVEEEEEEDDNNDPLPWETDERTANLPPWPADDPTPQPSRATNTLSSVPSTKSIEEHLLDSLRDSNTYSQPRSSGGRTFLTSPNSSPPRSPAYESFPPALAADEDGEGRYGFGEFGHQHHQQQRPNAANIRERRQSAQGARPPVLDAIIASTSTPPLPTDTQFSPSTPDLTPRRPARRTPPTAVKTRLSIVEDQPPPALLSDELMNEVGKPMVSPKSRARRQQQQQRAQVPVLPVKSGRRTSSLPGAQGGAGMGGKEGAREESQPEEEGDSDDEGKRDSIVMMRERRVPPKPLGSRGFIALAAEGGGAGAGAGAGAAPGGYGPSSPPSSSGYAGYGTYGGVAGGVSTGRVVKAVDRMVVRERGSAGGHAQNTHAYPTNDASFGARSPPLLPPQPPQQLALSAKGAGGGGGGFGLGLGALAVGLGAVGAEGVRMERGRVAGVGAGAGAEGARAEGTGRVIQPMGGKVVEMQAMGGVGVRGVRGEGVDALGLGMGMGPPLSPPPMRALPPLAPPPTRGLPPVPGGGGRGRGGSAGEGEVNLCGLTKGFVGVLWATVDAMEMKGREGQ
ncbi:hypothetical protein ACLOAV_006706 [Pseudogymnoascus australis]